MACFRCDACGTEEVRFNDRGMIDEPTKCSNANCGEKFTMKVVHNRSQFFDKQVVKMQARGAAEHSAQPALSQVPVQAKEAAMCRDVRGNLPCQVPVQAGRRMGSASQGVYPEWQPGGVAQMCPTRRRRTRTPSRRARRRTASRMLCYDEMVDTAKPGDRVTITGIYKATALRVNPRLKALKVQTSCSSHAINLYHGSLSGNALVRTLKQADRLMRGHNKSSSPLSQTENRCETKMLPLRQAVYKNAHRHRAREPRRGVGAVQHRPPTAAPARSPPRSRPRSRPPPTRRTTPACCGRALSLCIPSVSKLR